MKDLIDSFLEFEVINCCSMGSLGFPYNSQGDSVERAVAGFESYYSGNKSIDYYLKNYIKGNGAFKQNEDSFNHQFTIAIVKIRDFLINYIEHFRNIEKPDIPTLFASSVSFFRMENSFKGALICMKTGLTFEALSLERNILEQIAWIYKAHDYDGDFFELKSNKCIGQLATLFDKAGKLYGVLSDYLHISPKITTKYVNFEAEGGSVIMFNPDNLIESMGTLLTLMDWYFVMAEIIYFDLLEERFFINKDKSLKKNRPSLKLKNEILESLVTAYQKDIEY
ncbi:MAG: hypothetical protein PUK21_06915 [Peptostreptococcaceae bacterium]|nr:hypothetical protein [Peptostreptococcaceae bacterium]